MSWLWYLRKTFILQIQFHLQVVVDVVVAVVAKVITRMQAKHEHEPTD